MSNKLRWKTIRKSLKKLLTNHHLRKIIIDYLDNRIPYVNELKLRTYDILLSTKKIIYYQNMYFFSGIKRNYKSKLHRASYNYWNIYVY